MGETKFCPKRMKFAGKLPFFKGFRRILDRILSASDIVPDLTIVYLGLFGIRSKRGMAFYMNIENVKFLAEVLSAHGLTLIDVGEGENHIRIEKCTSAGVAAVQPDTTAISSVPTPNVLDDPDNQSVNFNNLIEVKSPLVGVFYSAASPESETFVSIGSKVKKGDVLCIIETMKLMNEIMAEQDGEIVDICVRNGDIAEFGQTLFKMF